MSSGMPNIVSNFIGGEYCVPRSGTYLNRINPTTGIQNGQSPDSDAVDIVMAVQAANKAFEKWSQTSVLERAQILNRIGDAIESQAEKFAELEAVDTGKPVCLSREFDVPKSALNFRYFAERILTDQATSNSSNKYSIRQPVGVCGLITSYDSPLYSLSAKLAPCLAMGNAAVCKPSPVSSLSVNLLTSILRDSGLAPGVCNVVYGRGETAGAALVQHPGVTLISFTGSTETGVKIQKGVGQKVKKIGLELGGKNANIVLKDADLKAAVSGSIRAAFSNSGQNCFSGSRLYVQEDIYEEFMTEFRAQADRLKIGNPLSSDTNLIGPLISEERLAKIEAAVAQARAEKAKVTVGGERPKGLPEEFHGGYFYAPTVIEDLDNCSDLWGNEIFGPVVTVQSFKYAHEAVKWANTSTYDLSASIWTADLERAHKLAREIKVGVVWLNTWGERDPRVPSDDALDFYSKLKTILL